jgi:hypothetical protein
MQCAVVELPSQTLLLAPDKSGRMLGMLFPGVCEFLFFYTFFAFSQLSYAASCEDTVVEVRS